MKFLSVLVPLATSLASANAAANYNISNPYYAANPTQFCSAWSAACWELAVVVRPDYAQSCLRPLLTSHRHDQASDTVKPSQGPSCTLSGTSINAGCTYQIGNATFDATSAVGTYFVFSEVLAPIRIASSSS